MSSLFSTLGTAFASRLSRDITFADIQRTATRFTDLLNDTQDPLHRRILVVPEDITEGGLIWQEWPDRHNRSQYKTCRFLAYGTCNDYPTIPSTMDAEKHVVYRLSVWYKRPPKPKGRMEVFVKAYSNTPRWTRAELEALRTAMDDCMGTKSTRVNAALLR